MGGQEILQHQHKLWNGSGILLVKSRRMSNKIYTLWALSSIKLLDQHASPHWPVGKFVHLPSQKL